MNAKWYISTLFLIFTLFGALNEKVIIPNQEIVLEFVDVKINRKNIDATILDLKDKLLNAGVSNINIKETKNGTLKISYYSATDINDIKELFSESNNLLEKNKSNQQKNQQETSIYNIDVYTISNQSDISKTDDTFILEIKYQSDRFTTNNSLVSNKFLLAHKTNQLYKTAYKVYKNNPFIKGLTSHTEPEVRAGPKNFTC